MTAELIWPLVASGFVIAFWDGARRFFEAEKGRQGDAQRSVDALRHEYGALRAELYKHLEESPLVHKVIRDEARRLGDRIDALTTDLKLALKEQCSHGEQLDTLTDETRPMRDQQDEAVKQLAKLQTDFENFKAKVAFSGSGRR